MPTRVQFLIEPLGGANVTRDEVAALWAARDKERDPLRVNAGIDVPCPCDIVIPPVSECGRAVKVGMGVRAVCLRAIPGGPLVGEAFAMHPRSSIAKTTLVLANSMGLFDVDYRGEVIAAFHNLGSAPVKIAAGTCLVQLAAGDLATPTHHVLEEGDLRAAAFGATARGGGGFGSSGATAEAAAAE